MERVWRRGGGCGRCSGSASWFGLFPGDGRRRAGDASTFGAVRGGGRHVWRREFRSRGRRRRFTSRMEYDEPARAGDRSGRARAARWRSPGRCVSSRRRTLDLERGRLGAAIGPLGSVAAGVAARERPGHRDRPTRRPERCIRDRLHDLASVSGRLYSGMRDVPAAPGGDAIGDLAEPCSDEAFARYRPWLYAAAVYNLGWGSINILFPSALLRHHRHRAAELPADLAGRRDVRAGLRAGVLVGGPLSRRVTGISCSSGFSGSCSGRSGSSGQRRTMICRGPSAGRSSRTTSSGGRRSGSICEMLRDIAAAGGRCCWATRRGRS